MQCDEGAYKANCDGGGYGYIVTIGNDGGVGNEKNYQIHTTNTTNITNTATKHTVR